MIESTPRAPVEDAGPGGETPYLSDATLVEEGEDSENEAGEVEGGDDGQDVDAEDVDDQDAEDGENGMDDEPDDMSDHSGDEDSQDEGSQATNDSVLGYPCPGTTWVDIKAGDVRDFGIDYFRQHARGIAKRHAVAPEDLALCE